MHLEKKTLGMKRLFRIFLVGVFLTLGLAPKNASAFFFEAIATFVATYDAASGAYNRARDRARLESALAQTSQNSANSNSNEITCSVVGQIKVCTLSDGSSNCTDLIGKPVACPVAATDRKGIAHLFTVTPAGQIYYAHGPADAQWNFQNSNGYEIGVPVTVYWDVPLTVLYNKNSGQASGVFHILGLFQDPFTNLTAIHYITCDESKLVGIASVTPENNPCLFRKSINGPYGSNIDRKAISAVIAGNNLYFYFTSSGGRTTVNQLPWVGKFSVTSEGGEIAPSFSLPAPLTDHPPSFAVLGDSIHLFGVESESGDFFHVITPVSTDAWRDVDFYSIPPPSLASAPKVLFRSIGGDSEALVIGTELLGGVFDVRPQARLWSYKMNSSLRLSFQNSYGTDVHYTQDYVAYNPSYKIAAVLDPKDSGQAIHFFYNGKSNRLGHAWVGSDGQYHFENIPNFNDSFIPDPKTTPNAVVDSVGNMHIFTVTQTGNLFSLVDYFRPNNGGAVQPPVIFIGLGKVQNPTPAVVVVE